MDEGSRLCQVCRAPCQGKALLVRDFYVHLQCFLCQACWQPLHSQSFYYNAGKFFCKEDYRRKFGQACTRCMEFIEGNMVSMENQHYHQKCFTCNHCRQSLMDGRNIKTFQFEIYCSECIPKANYTWKSRGPQYPVSETNGLNGRSSYPNPVTSPSRYTVCADDVFSHSYTQTERSGASYLTSVEDVNQNGANHSVLKQEPLPISPNLLLNRVLSRHMSMSNCPPMREYAVMPTPVLPQRGSSDTALQKPIPVPMVQKTVPTKKLTRHMSIFSRPPSLETSRKPAIVHPVVLSLRASPQIIPPDYNMAVEATCQAFQRMSTSEPEVESTSKHQVYPLRFLQMSFLSLPSDVNPKKLEMHLSDEEFFVVFSMTKSSFSALPEWKQIDLKKKAMLY